MPIPRRTNTALMFIPMLAAIACVVFIIILTLVQDHSSEAQDGSQVSEVSFNA